MRNRRDLIFVALIAAVAFGVRTYPAWQSVFGSDGVNFLETDAWYHVRLTESQVRNYPWRITLDPYAAPGGQFVPIAPLFDTVTATVVVLLHGRDAETQAVERVAAFVPPVLGTLTVIALWALGKRLFDRRAGLLGAALLTVLPGHFMDRTMLGFVDHHALESLLAVATLLALVRALDSRLLSAAVLSGVLLGLYLLTWASGAFLIGILAVWLVLLFPIARDAESLQTAGRAVGTTALVAFVFVASVQDPRMHRYGSQVVGLGGLAAIALSIALTQRREITRVLKVRVAAGMLIVGATAAITMWLLSPALVNQLTIDLARLAPDPTRMGVLEARPLFLYAGTWRWQQPWDFFRTGFYVGVVALVFFTGRIWRLRQPADVLVWVYALTTLVATIGQNRFGYYLMTSCSLLGGWLGARVLDWGDTRRDANATGARPRVRPSRELAALVVAGGMFAPNLAPAVLLMPRTASLPAYWQEAMTWLRRETPPPFTLAASAGDEYYYGRYPRDAVPLPDYSVMNWWDQGYWLTERARRVPVANPTQERASNAARFYVETDERRALAILQGERSRFVLSDWELPFRLTPDRTIMGRFQNVVDWAGATHARYYEVYYRREREQWTPVWIFHEPYYRSMAYRLTVLGGAAATPSNATAVITVADRVDPTGLRFRELLTEHIYATFDAARQAAEASTAALTLTVGLDPWRPAVPLEAVTGLIQRHAVKTVEQKPAEAPWVRIFEMRE